MARWDPKIIMNISNGLLALSYTKIIKELKVSSFLSTTDADYLPTRNGMLLVAMFGDSVGDDS